MLGHLKVAATGLDTGSGMLLTIDVGNTNTVLGVFRGEELIANWRLTTARAQTVDEYGVLTRNLFSYAGLNQESITGVMISSVVPPVNWTLAEMSLGSAVNWIRQFRL